MDTNTNNQNSQASQPKPAENQAPPPTQTPPPTPPPPKKVISTPVIIMLLIFSFMGGLLLAAWYFQIQLKMNLNNNNNSQQIVANGPKKIIVGTDATFQPMEYTNDKGGLVGYDIDLGYRIANDLGAKIEFKNIPWDDLFPALEKKQIDMIISGVTITDERKQKYEFSEPYLNAGQVIITKTDNTTITSPQQMKGKRVGVQEGTTNEQEAAKYTDPTLVVKFPDFEQATKALVDGKVDAILSDLTGAKGIVLANPSLKISSDPFTNEYYGVVFRKSDPNVKKINDVLTSLRVKGILTDLKQKWLD